MQLRKHKAFGEEKTVAEWAEDPRCVVSKSVLYSRLSGGMELEKAITTPRKDKLVALDKREIAHDWLRKFEEAGYSLVKMEEKGMTL